VAEIPTIWLDRPAGISNFKVAKWLPKYLRWYRFAFGPRLDQSTSSHELTDPLADRRASHPQNSE